jgi:hypothetical protein
VAAAGEIYAGMLGLSGVELPERIVGMLQSAGVAPTFVGTTTMSLTAFVLMVAAVAAGLLIALLLPNTLQIMSAYEPALGSQERPANTGLRWLRVRWSPSLVWAVVVAGLAAVAIYRAGGPSEFLYWQF